VAISIHFAPSVWESDIHCPIFASVSPERDLKWIEVKIEDLLPIRRQVAVDQAMFGGEESMLLTGGENASSSQHKTKKSEIFPCLEPGADQTTPSK